MCSNDNLTYTSMCFATGRLIYRQQTFTKSEDDRRIS